MNQSDALKLEFEQLTNSWDTYCQENFYSSNFDTFLDHQSFSKLKGLGRPIIPLIIDRYEKDGSARWGFLLEEITEEGLTKDRDNFSPPEMRDAWLNWYKAQH